MDRKTIRVLLTCLAVLLMFSLSAGRDAFAHCDGMDGPVVTAAKKALETGNVNLVLIWVQPNYEEQIRQAFQKTLNVRKLTPEAKELADLYFFETLVRIHRAGEGEPFTGLKPAGRDLGPAIPAADRAVSDGKLEPLYKVLTDKIHDGLHERFKRVMEKKKFGSNDLKAGREFVEAYVILLHYVEGLYDAAGKGAHGHPADHAGEQIHNH